MPVARLRSSSESIKREAQRLYEDSFPASERSAFEELLERENTDDDSTFLVLLDSDDHVLALCVASGISYPAGFLEYFAVTPDRRGSGIGSTFLNDCVAQILVPPREGVVLEIERPEAEPDDSYREVRKRFWLKNGARVIVDRLLVPRLDGSGELEMSLLWIAPPGGEEPFPFFVASQVLTEGYGLDDEVARNLMERSGLRWHG